MKNGSTGEGSPPVQFEAEADMGAETYLRNFATALERFEEFDGFIGALREAVAKDSRLIGSAWIGDPGAGISEPPDFGSIAERHAVVAITAGAGPIGHLEYQGRKDGRPFGAEDLHLMGALSDLISVLVLKADIHRRSRRSADVLEYLVGQLPLGVVCFDSHGGLIVKNKRALLLLGEPGEGLLREQLAAFPSGGDGRFHMHFEVEGRFLYTEGRRLSVNGTTEVSAFVLYDMTPSREKLQLGLEREIFLSESRRSRLVAVLVRNRGRAGLAFRTLRDRAEALGLEAREVQAVDAESGLVLFRGGTVRAVRELLRAGLDRAFLEASQIAIARPEPDAAAEEVGEALLRRLESGLARGFDAFMPVVGVLDPYPEIAKSIHLLAGAVCRLVTIGDARALEASIARDELDGLIIDLDSISAPQLRRLTDETSSLRRVFMSYRQPGMARRDFDLPPQAKVLQKPFDAEAVERTLSETFKYA